MMGRSHLLVAGAGYAALAARPLDTPLVQRTMRLIASGMMVSIPLVCSRFDVNRHRAE